MSDQSEMMKEKKKMKPDKKPKTEESNIPELEASVVESANKNKRSENKTKDKQITIEGITIPTINIPHEKTAFETKMSDEHEDLTYQESVKQDIMKFKEQLLQSVAQNDKTLQTPHEEADDKEEMLARIRERSSSRAYEVPDFAPVYSDVLIELDENKLSELKEAFLLFDLDGDGCISHGDLRATLVSLGQHVDDDEIRQMLSEAAHPLDLDAFVALLGYRSIELDPEETLAEALGQWDQAGTGLIPEERIRHDLMTWGDKFTSREVDWALEDAPKIDNGRGDPTLIEYLRFCKVLCGLRKATKRFNE